jgi:hypothetical protein
MARRQKRRPTGIKVPGTGQQTPGRAADRPFCAYMGEAGETCSETTHLETILIIQGPSRMALAACPRHRGEVQQLANAFALHSQFTPQTILFRYHGNTYRVQARGTARKGTGQHLRPVVRQRHRPSQ